jgi:hypothetical protein
MWGGGGGFSDPVEGEEFEGECERESRSCPEWECGDREGRSGVEEGNEGDNTQPPAEGDGHPESKVLQDGGVCRFVVRRTAWEFSHIYGLECVYLLYGGVGSIGGVTSVTNRASDISASERQGASLSGESG